MNKIDSFLEIVNEMKIKDNSISREELLFKYSILTSVLIDALKEMDNYFELGEMIIILDELYHRLPNSEIFYIIRYKYFYQRKIVSEKIMDAILSLISDHENHKCPRQNHSPASLDDQFIKEVKLGELISVDVDDFNQFLLDIEIDDYINRQTTLEKNGFWQNNNDEQNIEALQLIILIAKIFALTNTDLLVEKYMHEIYHQIPKKNFSIAIELINGIEIENRKKILLLLEKMKQMHSKNGNCYRIKRG